MYPGVGSKVESLLPWPNTCWRSLCEASMKPLYREMVVDAIVTQKEKLGSSLSATKNHLRSKYNIVVNKKAGFLNR